MTRCPVCHGSVDVRSTVLDIRAFSPLPRQVEPFVRIYKWQCLRRQEHSGAWREAEPNAPRR
jgi:hypothetical protein